MTEAAEESKTIPFMAVIGPLAALKSLLPALFEYLLEKTRWKPLEGIKLVGEFSSQANDLNDSKLMAKRQWVGKRQLWAEA
jgi:hypothetical protein